MHVHALFFNLVPASPFCRKPFANWVLRYSESPENVSLLPKITVSLFTKLKPTFVLIV